MKTSGPREASPLEVTAELGYDRIEMGDWQAARLHPIWKVSTQMPDDNRLDLGGDLDKLTGDLLKDVTAATAEVKKRKEKIAAQDAKEAEKTKSRKTQMLLVAIGAVVVLIISYLMVFAKPQEDQTDKWANKQQVQTQQATPITSPGATRSTATTTRHSAGGVAGQGSQVVEHPSDEYEQPSDDGGM